MNFLQPSRNAQKRRFHLLAISRQEIEAASTEGTLAYLNRLISDRESALKNHSSMVLRIQGYKSRAVFTIPEVRTFMRAVHNEWPYWHFFMNRLDASESLVQACIVTVRSPKRGSIQLDEDESATYNLDCQKAMMDLFVKFNLTEEERKVITTGFWLQRIREAEGI